MTIAEKYKKLHEECLKYPQIQLVTRGGVIKVNPELDSIKMSENGFIEKSCLSDEQRNQIKESRKRNKQLIKRN